MTWLEVVGAVFLVTLGSSVVTAAIMVPIGLAIHRDARRWRVATGTGSALDRYKVQRERGKR